VLFETVGRYYQPTSVKDESGAQPEDAPRPETAAHSPVVVEAALPTVEGLDTADGLLRVAGNRSLYLRLLRQFVTQQAEAPASIAEALSAGDRAMAERLAHTVKGVAGNLGAGPVQAAAGALEHAIAAGVDAGDFEALRRRLAEDLEALIGRLRVELDDDVPAAGDVAAGSTDREALKTLLAEMRKQLSEFDPGAADLLEGNRGPFRALLGDEDFASFEGHIQGYAFGDAQALLERAAAALGI